MDASEVSRLVDYIASTTYPEDFTKDQKRRLREKAASFTVADRVLYHLGNGEKKQKVVVGEEEKMKIIETLHSSIVGGCHFGQNATIAKVTERYWWRSMSNDVREFCKRCPACQKANPNNRPQVASLHPVPVKELFHRWGIDLIGPLKETVDGFRYIIVATEYLTRSVEVAALPDKKAISIHQFLMQLVYRYGASQVLLHDQGREFCNFLVKDLCDILATDQATTSPYHPQSNGLTERFNQTMITQLMKMVNKDADDWDKFLQPVAFAYRTNIQASTKTSPFELLYGQKARLPIDLEEAKDDKAVWDVDVEAVADRMTKLADVMLSSRATARDNIEKAQSKQKRRYDLKHSSPVFQVGQRVTIINRRRDTRMGDKLAPRYFGPYVIHESLGKGVYLLRSGEKVLKSRYNATHLKIWHDPLVTDAPAEGDTVSVTTDDAATDVTAKEDCADTFWVKDLNLRLSDRDDIESGQWVNDRVIDAASKLVTSSTGLVNQSSLLSQTEFKPIHRDTVQILHDSDHWVTVSSNDRGVMYADSTKRAVSEHINKQLKQIFQNKRDSSGNLTVELLPCQLQTNGSDCGIFAIANAVELSLGNSLHSCRYDIAKMRPHLVQCLIAHDVSPFPKTVTRGRPPKSKIITL